MARTTVRCSGFGVNEMSESRGLAGCDERWKMEGLTIFDLLEMLGRGADFGEDAEALGGGHGGLRLLGVVDCFGGCLWNVSKLGLAV